MRKRPAGSTTNVLPQRKNQKEPTSCANYYHKRDRQRAGNSSAHKSPDAMCKLQLARKDRFGSRLGDATLSEFQGCKKSKY